MDGTLDGDGSELTALMWAAQGGDRTAYRRLLVACEPLIRQMALDGGVHDGRIADVVRETLLSIHAARRTFGPDDCFPTWLRALTRHRADVAQGRGESLIREPRVREPKWQRAPAAVLDATLARGGRWLFPRRLRS